MTQADEVAFAQSQGLAMVSRYVGAIIGFTTDEAKADACREQGLEVRSCYNATGPRGWEIVARPDPAPVGAAPTSRSPITYPVEAGQP